MAIGPLGLESNIYVKRTILYNAQIKALPVTAITVVPAPSVGRANVLVMAFLQTNFVSAYTNIDADASAPYIYIDTGGSDVRSNYLYNVASGNATYDHQLTAFLTGLGGRFALLTPLSIQTALGVSTWGTVPPAGVWTQMDNAPFQLTCVNGGAFTGGNAANKLKVTVYYTVEEIL